MKKGLAIKVHGQVQDVNLRAELRIIALTLGITGYARNEPDGGVYIVAMGEEVELTEFEQAVRSGPGSSNIESVDINGIPYAEMDGFKRI